MSPDINVDTYTDLLTRLNGIINLIVPVILGLAVLVIIWGVFNYIVGAGDEEKRAQAKTYIIWGVIGIFIMLSVWGLVNILVNTFDLGNTAPDTNFLSETDPLYSGRNTTGF